MAMETVCGEAQLQARIAGPALLVLFGGAHCGVCQAIRPRIESMVAQSFPQFAMAYVDCAQAPAVCAQQGVFSLPVLRFYLGGQLVLERGRSFSLQEVGAEMERLWGLFSS